ncbi:putative translation initiation factor eIF-2B subunit epsilon [Chlorella vulgaris]
MQAIVLLHDEECSRPLGTPTWAMPIGDQPAVEMTLRWLQRSAIDEVYLVASSSSAGQLSAYLQQAGWAVPWRGMVINVLAAPGCLSEGEALRFVAQEDIVKGDFVLVSGSVLGNADLLPAMQAHAARRNADRQALMTLLLHRQSSSATMPGTISGTCMVAADPCSKQLLRLEQCWTRGTTSLGTHIFGERNAVAVRSGYQLSGVYICAQDALVLLSDNFDYQSIASDLVPGVLAEQELGSTLYIHELARGYVEQVCSSAYVGMLADMVGRWTYPWVPDNTGDRSGSCRFNRGTYVDASAFVAPSSRITKGSLVGRGSRVDVGACLNRCILGRDCHIGESSTLQASCLHAQACVEDNCQVSFALLGERALVRSHAHLETGTVLAKHTVVDAAHCVSAGTCVSLAQPMSAGESEDEGEDTSAEQHGLIQTAAAALAAGGIPETAVAFHTDTVGPFGAGFAWKELGSKAFLVPPSLSTFTGQLEPAPDSEAGDFTKARRVKSLDASTTDDVSIEDPGQRPTDQFKCEVSETILRCITEGISHNNAVIELNGLKIAEDRTFADCARYVFITMLSLCLPPSSSVKPEYMRLFPDAQVDICGREGRLELLRRLNGQLKAWKGLLQRFLKSNDDQVELLLSFEEYCLEDADVPGAPCGSLFSGLFPQVVKLCYDHELLCEEAILAWAREKEHAAQEDRRFVELCVELLEWLDDAEEESD